MLLEHFTGNHFKLMEYFVECTGSICSYFLFLFQGFNQNVMIIVLFKAHYDSGNGMDTLRTLGTFDLGWIMTSVLDYSTTRNFPKSFTTATFTALGSFRVAWFFNHSINLCKWVPLGKFVSFMKVFVKVSYFYSVWPALYMVF